MSGNNTGLRVGVILLVSILAGCSAGNAGTDDDHERARALSASGAIVPLEQVTADARARHSGRVVEVELKSGQGRSRYEVELIDDRGVIWELLYDATSGELLEEYYEE